MPGTYHSILLHIVFSTKHRTPWITPEVRERLYPFLGGIIRTEKERSTTSAASPTTSISISAGDPTATCPT